MHPLNLQLEIDIVSSLNKLSEDLSTYIIDLVLSAEVVLSIHPSKFLIREEEDDGTGGGPSLTAAAAVYPHVHVILLAQFILALRNCFCVVCRNAGI
jgi:hypothetical protein